MAAVEPFFWAISACYLKQNKNGIFMYTRLAGKARMFLGLPTLFTK